MTTGGGGKVGTLRTNTAIPTSILVYTLHKQPPVCVVAWVNNHKMWGIYNVLTHGCGYGSLVCGDVCCFYEYCFPYIYIYTYIFRLSGGGGGGGYRVGPLLYTIIIYIHPSSL